MKLQFIYSIYSRKFLTGGIVLFIISISLILYESLQGMLQGYIIITCMDLITTLALSLIVFTTDYSDYYKILGKQPDRSAFFGFSLLGYFILLVAPLFLIGFLKEVSVDRKHALAEMYRYAISATYTIALMWICSELSKDAIKRSHPKPQDEKDLDSDEIVSWVQSLPK